ncbi:hypothetical protein X975_10682, partial [Stegodyphus mimosarum]
FYKLLRLRQTVCVLVLDQLLENCFLLKIKAACKFFNSTPSHHSSIPSHQISLRLPP